MVNSRCSITPLFLFVTLVLSMAIPAAAQTTVVIYPGDMGTWGFLEETATGGGAMMLGPGTPPSGLGSAQLVVDGTGGELLGTTDFGGTLFSTITELAYSTFRVAPTGGILAPTLQFNVDYDLTDANTSWQGRLVFEPYYTGAPVLDATWQTWNPMTAAAAWWATGAPGNVVCSQGSPCTWAEVLAAFPNAGIQAPPLSGVLLKAGGGWSSGYDGNVDALVIGIGGVTTTFDFELDVPVELQSFIVE